MPVMISTGISAQPGRVRITAQDWNPSMTGIMPSSSTRSGGVWRQISTACWPFVASITEWPSPSSVSRNAKREPRSSSTIRIRDCCSRLARRSTATVPVEPP